ncbi:MAG: hypothetical protein EHM48_00075 [Planctomycetaceae bacterium]|nr:MAG: hypothetical protein EHM48_00075 [Planctomycetaceae bacterium]
MTNAVPEGTELVLAKAMRELAANMISFATLLESSPLSPVPVPVSSVLAVPYRSQWDADGSDYASDCGPACVAMVLEHYGVRVDINQLARDAGMVTGRPYTLPADLIRAADLHGVTLIRRLPCVISDLAIELDAGRPAIVLIHYGSLNNRQDRNYTKGHWVVVVGVDRDTVYIHDPNWRGNVRDNGRALAVSRVEFYEAWEKCKLDGNSARQCLMVVRTGTAQ